MEEAGRRKVRYIPVGFKLMLSYFVFIIIPVLLIGFVSHSMYVDSIRKQTEMNLRSTLKQISDNVYYKLQDVKRISDMLYNDATLARQLRIYSEGYDNYDRTVNIIMPKFSAALNATGQNIWMSIYLKNESLPERYYDVYESEHPDTIGRNYNMYQMSRIQDKEWYKNFPKEIYGETISWQSVGKDLSFNRISLLRRLIDNHNPLNLEELGFIRISVSKAELFQSIDYSLIGKGSVLMLKDDAGKVIYHSGERTTDDVSNVKSGYYLTINEKLADMPWQLEAYVPMTIIDQDTFKVRLFTFMVCLICFVVFTFLGIFISRYFSKRVTKIVSVLNAFREGDLSKRFSYSGKDEFAQIATALNDVGENIGELIEEVYLTQIEKKEAELEILQSQINPHFLYNTLSSINRLAKFGETEKLQRMVLELAKFYRLTLNEGRTMIPVRTEIEQANAYLQIQKIKYGERMDVRFDVHPDIWPYETVKLVLQPFIENVLEHAWCGDRIHLRIVAAKDGDDILFRIIDDGIGMSQERIDQIFHPKEHVNAGYGIRNVDQRIKLQYGAAYGVKIASKLGIGTAVDIRIPAKRIHSDSMKENE
ncbi:sensor histidine kinase [Paenibacillus aquistagni]|uniref:histidine kinase n=1 Tax=Paenibacillus aquistagni TaxID=1852522 RepID=A0A1X7JMD2_9BACL|nr:sensor histidine kinase [Paenibacillus aquistagni]SMG29021.1 two-component system, sensor histidine kinase YesM [Paenibacillus aquistagni]